MKNCDFKQVLKTVIVFYVLLKFGSVETAALTDCPPHQVLHFNTTTNIGTCCIPVVLPKGYGFKSCTVNGTYDTIEVCPTKPVQLYQWDDTTTDTEATCMAEMPCLDVENKMIEKCDEYGQNCRKECVCNFPGGFCGMEYFNCIPFPVGCPRNNVQKDCSCRSPGLEPEENSSKSYPGLPNSVTLITSVKMPPLSPASGNSDKTVEGDQTTDVGIMTEKDNNNNDTKSQKNPEESLSTGSIIGLKLAVIVVIGGLIFLFFLRKDRYKRLWGKCKRENKDLVDNPVYDSTEPPTGLIKNSSATGDVYAAVEKKKKIQKEDLSSLYAQVDKTNTTGKKAQPKPIQKVTPFKQNSSEDQNEDALSLQRQLTVSDEPVERELMTLPLLSEGSPQEVNGAQTNLLEVPQMNLSLHFPPLGSSLFDSHISTADQQEASDASGRDQTHVKVASTSENLIEEEGHDSGALENSRLCHERVEPSLAREREGEEDEQLIQINNSLFP